MTSTAAPAPGTRADDAPGTAGATPAPRIPDFDRLYGEMVPRVHGLVRRLVVDSDLRNDIVQETFVRAYVNGLHEEDRDPWPWLAAVARNLALDALRRRRTYVDEAIDDELVASTRRAADPDAELVASSERRAVTEVLFELTPQQRRILVLHHLEGCSYRELAAREGMSLEAVRSSLARARRRFRRRYVAVSERRTRPPERGGVPAVEDRAAQDDPSTSEGWWFEQLIEEHAGPVRRIAVDLLGETDAARTVVEETFRRARVERVHLDRREGRSRSPWPWLATTARNLALEVAGERAYAPSAASPDGPREVSSR